MTYVKRAGDPDTWIPKEKLVPYTWYKGKCRNAEKAFWDGHKFVYKRHKFGTTFMEDIPCPEDDIGFDVFFAQEEYYDDTGN